MRRMLLGAITAGIAALFSATSAFACGGLVAPDGDVHLSKATTFVAWHDGIEHYVTSFAYTGNVPDVGWIVPLPAVPSDIEAAGRWTLQRLELQFNPPRLEPLALTQAAAADGASSVVVEQTQVEALDITVLKGSGDEVLSWCEHNGFLVPPDTANHLLRYATGSPVFMAAKYDTAAAQQRGLQEGDGVPLLITMRTSQLWVPLEVLANDDNNVNADLFLLTDEQPHPALSQPWLGAPASFVATLGSLDGAPGFTVSAQQQMNDQLVHDLSSDRNMSWLPQHGWLTYLRLNAPSDQVTYDLAVGSDNQMRLAAFGTSPQRAVPPEQDPRPLVAVLIALATATAALLVITCLRWTRGRARRLVASR